MLKSAPLFFFHVDVLNKLLYRVNVKLGGINVIPDPSSLAAEALADPVHPTLVMGKCS